MKKKKSLRFLLGGLILLLVAAMLWWDPLHLLPHASYTAEDFSIQTVYSAVDYNGNGIDDYSDFVAGARADAARHPDYDPSYCAGGYPSDDKGVCADVIWRAFKAAGYSLRDMIDKDIAERTEAYVTITKPDSNIDFRRVRNLRVFFEKYAVSLTTDITDIEAWQPGDIVIFRQDKHIGLISDKRNRRGQPYVIHNGGQSEREQDYLGQSEVTGHYRFDASLVPEEYLLPWHD